MQIPDPLNLKGMIMMVVGHLQAEFQSRRQSLWKSVSLELIPQGVLNWDLAPKQIKDS